MFSCRCVLGKRSASASRVRWACDSMAELHSLSVYHCLSTVTQPYHFVWKSTVNIWKKYAELSNCIRITSQCDWSRLCISPNKSPITHRTSPILRRKYTIMSYNYSRTRTKQACSLYHDLIISAYVCVTTDKIICLAGNVTSMETLSSLYIYGWHAFTAF